MNITEINPYIRSVHRIKRRPRYKKTKCPDARLFYIISGKGTITVNDSEYEFGSNSVMLWDAGCVYSWTFDRSERIDFIVINFDYTQKFSFKKDNLRLIPEKEFTTARTFQNEKFENADCLNEPLIIDNFIRIKDTIEEIYNLFTEHSPYCDIVISGLFKAIIGKIAKKKMFAPVKTGNKLVILLDFLRKNYDKDFSNKELSEMINYHPNYINNLMKYSVGTTLHNYIITLRLNEAINLLENTTMSIDEISRKVGFKTPSHFTTVFKKHYGINPSEYKKG